MFDADISKTCKQSWNICEWITIFMPRVVLWTCGNKTHRKNDCECASICWGYRTLTEVPDSRDRTLVLLVLQARISKACNDLIVQCNCCDRHKWKRILSYLIAVFTSRQTSWRPLLGEGKWCSRSGSTVKGDGRMAGKVDIFNVKKYCVS